LIIREGIHGIEQEGSHTRSEPTSSAFFQEIINNGQQKTFCFSRASSRGDNNITVFPDNLSYGALLMRIEVAIEGKALLELVLSQPWGIV